MGGFREKKFLRSNEILKKNQYGQYLKDVLDGKYQRTFILRKKKDEKMTIIVTGEPDL